METKIKWNEGDGYITATYEGSGNGSASISSDVNEGIDREQSIKVETTDKSVSATLIVSQEGLREVFETSDGGFILANGGTFNVLKVGGDTPDVPVETYTRLTYIECNGKQFIDLGYIVKEDDVIEANFILTKIASADHFLFGTAKGSAGLWFEIYSNTAYVRFGQSASNSISSSSYKYSMRLEKGQVTIGTTTTALDFEEMPEAPIYLFSGRQSNGDVYSRGYYRCTKFRISGSNGIAIDLIPVKRDSDGVIGMLDVVSGTFYTSGDEPFIGGSEVQVADGYEALEYTTFDGTQLYDLGLVKSEYELEVLFQRSETKETPYLYGIVTSPHTASVTAYMSSGGSWRWGSAYKGISTNNLKEWRVRMKNGNALYNGTSSNFSKSTFTTPDTVVLGGYRTASGSLVRGYKGKVFYIRISEDGEYILDWYPCKRLSDGVEGFWDCVTQSFVEPI